MSTTTPSTTDRAAIAAHHAVVARLKRKDAHRVALAAAAADKTDPFIYGRVFTHMMNGIGQQWSFERRE